MSPIILLRLVVRPGELLMPEESTDLQDTKASRPRVNGPLRSGSQSGLPASARNYFGL